MSAASQSIMTTLSEWSPCASNKASHFRTPDFGACLYSSPALHEISSCCRFLISEQWRGPCRIHSMPSRRSKGNLVAASSSGFRSIASEQVDSILSHLCVFVSSGPAESLDGRCLFRTRLPLRWSSGRMSRRGEETRENRLASVTPLLRLCPSNCRRGFVSPLCSRTEPTVEHREARFCASGLVLLQFGKNR